MNFSRFLRCNSVYKFQTKILNLGNVRHLSSKSDNLVIVTENENNKTANIVMNRAPVNSLNLELLQALTNAIKEVESKKMRGFILTSSSPTVFSAGLDITEMYKPDPVRFNEFWKSLQLFWKTLYLTPLVTIAAVNGHAPAGGCLITLSCDYRIMVDSKVTIGLNETKLGLAAPLWFQNLFVHNIGFRQAEKALNLGTLFTPQEAVSLNIIDELASGPDDLKIKAEKQLEIWTKIPAAARQTTKMYLRKPLVDALNKYAEQEADQVLQFAQLEGTQKALGRYFEGLQGKK